MIFGTQGSECKGSAHFQSITLACLLFICSALISISHAKDLYITDDYLQGLDDEITSVDYVEQAKKELAETEKQEQAQTSTSAEIKKALTSMYNFETLIKNKYPSSHNVYSRLSISTRILIYSEFKKTKKLSTAKRLILEKNKKK
jgi:hypothetical protein